MKLTNNLTIDDLQLLINSPCKIVPFEKLEGTIVGVYITKRGVEYQVRYYSNFEQKTDYFFAWELSEVEPLCQK